MPHYEVLPSGKIRASVYVGFIDGARKYERFIAPTQEQAAMLAYEFLIELRRQQKFNQLPLDERMTVSSVFMESIMESMRVFGRKNVPKHEHSSIYMNSLSAP